MYARIGAFFSRVSAAYERRWLGFKSRTGLSTEALICTMPVLAAGFQLFVVTTPHDPLEPKVEVVPGVLNLKLAAEKGLPADQTSTIHSNAALRELWTFVQSELRAGDEQHVEVLLQAKSMQPIQSVPPNFLVIGERSHFAHLLLSEHEYMRASAESQFFPPAVADCLTVLDDTGSGDSIGVDLKFHDPAVKPDAQLQRASAAFQLRRALKSLNKFESATNETVRLLTAAAAVPLVVFIGHRFPQFTLSRLLSLAFPAEAVLQIAPGVTPLAFVMHTNWLALALGWYAPTYIKSGVARSTALYWDTDVVADAPSHSFDSLTQTDLIRGGKLTFAAQYHHKILFALFMIQSGRKLQFHPLGWRHRWSLHSTLGKDAHESPVNLQLQHVPDALVFQAAEAVSILEEDSQWTSNEPYCLHRWDNLHDLEL